MTSNEKRIRLRTLLPEDAQTIQRLASEPRVAATTLAIPHPYPDGEALRWIESHAALRDTGHVIWGIELRETIELVGVVALIRDPLQPRAELGYWLGAEYWNNGYMSEAVQAAVDWGFAHWDIARIFAQHFAGNTASGRVMQKAGMTLEGTLRHCVRKDGQLIDTPLYSILRGEWEGRQRS